MKKKNYKKITKQYPANANKLADKKLIRMLIFLLELDKRTVDIKKIAGPLQVNLRTLQRYIIDLKRAGIPLVKTPEINSLYYLNDEEMKLKHLKAVGNEKEEEMQRYEKNAEIYDDLEMPQDIWVQTLVTKKELEDDAKREAKAISRKKLLHLLNFVDIEKADIQIKLLKLVGREFEYKDRKKSLMFFEEVTKEFPQYDEFWLKKGDAYSRLKRYNKALMCFQKVIDNDASNVWARIKKLTTMRSAKRVKEALEISRKYIAIFPKEPLLHRIHIYLLMDNGLLKEALKATRDLLPIDAGDRYFFCSRIYSKMGKYDTALRAIRKAIKIGPSKMYIMEEKYLKRKLGVE